MRDRWGPLRAEARQCRELARLFFGRFLENDLISIDGDTRAALVNLLALLAAPGVVFPLLVLSKYGNSATEPMWVRDWQSLQEKAFYLSFSMTVLAVVTILEWDALFPDRRDYAVLRPFPIRLGTIFAAKSGALIAFWAIFTLAVNALSSTVFPAVVTQRGTLWTMAWFIRCHFVSVLLGNAFVFLALVAVQGLLMNLLGWRLFRRVSPFAQLGLIAAVLAMFFATQEITSTIGPDLPASPVLLAFPPAWFLGFYQHELGWRQEVFAVLASRAQAALLIAAATAAVAYALSYRGYVRASLEAMDAPALRPGRLSLGLASLFDRRILRSAAERAAFHFTVDTILRSRRHKVLLAAWAGGGLALVFQGLAALVATGMTGWWRNPRGPLLPVPLLLSLLVLLGVRYAFTIPSELSANWIFQVSTREEPRTYLRGVRKAVILTAAVPLFAALLPAYLAVWDPLPAALHILFGLVVSVLAVDVLLAGFEKLPFTCSYVPGKANIKVYWPLYATAFVLLLGVLTGFEAWMLHRPLRFLCLIVLVAVVKAALALYRHRVMLENFEFIYDDRPEPAVRTLNLIGP